jgi:hypothetical protein
MMILPITWVVARLRISKSVLADSHIAELVLNSLSHATEDEFAIDRDHKVRRRTS